ncbi:hypothetical protein Y032_0519g2835 [Ancylostoma ceylanicum]|uniref:Uncharacterized protein n=1 Tax=Ancylostoma ceylanicum TaxID=53326 RepID=A0A016WUR2_9BILA|nr:hypothetical protein Y032_0519g2835 [Ancylostoma ceylanicum]
MKKDSKTKDKKIRLEGYKNPTSSRNKHSNPFPCPDTLTGDQDEPSRRSRSRSRPSTSIHEDRKKRKKRETNVIDNKDCGTTAATGAVTTQPDNSAQEVYRGRAPGPFVPGTSWRAWWKLFTNFLTLRKVVDEKERRLVFLQEVGNSNHELLESLLQGQELEVTDLADLCNAMEKHFQPKKLILAERFGLMSKSQKPGSRKAGIA